MMLPRLAELAGALVLRVPAIWPVAAGVNAGASVLGYEPGAALAVVEDLAVGAGTNAGAALATCAPPAFDSVCLARSEGSCGAVWAIAVDSGALAVFDQGILGVDLQPSELTPNRAVNPATSTVCFMASMPCFFADASAIHGSVASCL